MKIVSILITILLLASCGEKKGKEATSISGRIQGVWKPVEGHKIDKIQRLVINDGRFYFIAKDAKDVDHYIYKIDEETGNMSMSEPTSNYKIESTASFDGDRLKISRGLKFQIFERTTDDVDLIENEAIKWLEKEKQARSAPSE